MLTHIVLFKLKDTSPEAVARTIAIVEEMRGKIPEMTDLEVGVDVVHSGRSYDLALIVRLTDLDGLEAYRNHSAHQPVLSHLHEATSAAVAVDFES